MKFNLNIKNLLNNLQNFNFKNFNLFFKRFEFFFFKFNTYLTFLNINLNFKKIINMYFSRYININYSYKNLIKYNLIRLYLIKSFKGKCAFLGKPSRGQRTWSNAKNSKKNNFLKPFIIKIVNSFKKKENINDKNTKIIKLKKKKILMKLKLEKKKLNNWF